MATEAKQEHWLAKSAAAIGDVLAGVERLGACGGTIPLFTADAGVAAARAAGLAKMYDTHPGRRGSIRLDQLSLDTSDDPPQYRVALRV
jgi:hypothetical protein